MENNTNNGVNPTPINEPVVNTPGPIGMPEPTQSTPTPIAPPMPTFTPATTTVPPVEGLNNNMVKEPVQEQTINNVQEPIQTPPINQGNGIIPTEKGKNNNTIIIIILIAVALIIGGLLLGGKDENNNDNKETTTTKKIGSIKDNYQNKTQKVPTTTTTNKIIPNTTQKPENDNLALNEAKYNGVTITIPATKESFVGTGWTWDNEYTNTDLDPGYSTIGGRIGEYPGGVTVNVSNNSNTVKKVKDCTIDIAIFYNPEDGSENVSFIGGINYSSTIDEVKQIMSNLGYKNGEEDIYEESTYLTYYKNDDKLNNFASYTEFYFYNGKLDHVTISN